MQTFVNQPGVPMITASTRCESNKTQVTLAQQRYFTDRKLFEEPHSELWQAPVCLKSPAAAGKESTRCEVLTQKQQTVELPGCVPWVFANGGAVGYFRTREDREATQKIAAAAEQSLTAGERIVLLNDEWALVQVGQHDVGDYYNVAEHFKNEPAPQVLSYIAGRVGRTHDYLLSSADQSKFQVWVRDFFRPTLERVGWKAQPGEPADARVARAMAIRMLGRFGRDPEVLRQARALAEQYMNDPKSGDPDLVDVVGGLSGLHGDAAPEDKV